MWPITLSSFDPEFQKEAWEKYKETHNLTDDQAKDVLLKYANDEDLNDDEDDLIDACELLRVSLSDGNIQIAEYEYGDAVESERGWSNWDLVDFLEKLGYDISFEGDSWKLETSGVYYLE